MFRAILTPIVLLAACAGIVGAAQSVSAQSESNAPAQPVFDSSFPPIDDAGIPPSPSPPTLDASTLESGLVR